MKWYVPLTLLATLLASQVHANEDLDVTMRMVVDDGELTESVVREIALPMPAPVEKSGQPEEERVAPGLDTARDAREQGRQFGKSMAETARGSGGRVSERLQRPELPDQVKDARDNLPDVAKPVE